MHSIMASTKTEIIGPLNPEQRDTALHKGGIVAVVAGPGTGKTKSQVACAALKVLSGMEPQSIAMITFTNKAANEMQERLVKHIDEDAWRVFVGTFHQLAIKKILRPNIKADYLANKGYQPGFNIIDKSDSKTLIREAKQSLSESELNQLEFANVDEDFLQNVMTQQKAKGNDWKDVVSHISNINQVYEFISEHTPGNGLSDNTIKDAFAKNYQARLLLAVEWWSSYESLCIKNNAMDFDDLLVNASKLLSHHKEVAAKLGRMIQHLQVDEYQDTAPVQFDIVKTIIDNQNKKSATVVGDMRQAIYGFRGADSTSMKKFVDYFDAEIKSMNRNYRTAAASIDAINQFGETMAEQLTDGHLLPMSNDDEPAPQILHFKSDEEEAEHIVKEVSTLLKEGVEPNDIAIIYRAKAVNRPIKSLLENNRVQYDVVGDVDFYNTKEVKIGISVLRLFVNENDRFALHNIMSEMPIGITKATLAKKASQGQCSQMEALRSFAKSGGARSHKANALINELADISNFIPSLSEQELAFSKNLPINEYRHRLNYDPAFQDHIRKQNALFAKDTAPLFGERLKRFFTEHVLHSFNNDARKAAIKKHPEASEEEIENIVVEKLNERTERVVKLTEIFSKTIESGVDFKDAVDEIMLLADNTKNNKEGSIKLMTGHASKGLEFKHVFFAGAEQEMFFRDEPNDDTLAEEERNLYVITTRHKKRLTITHCDTRFVNGQFVHCQPLEMLLRFKGKVIENSLDKISPPNMSELDYDQTEALYENDSDIGHNAASLINKIKSKSRVNKTPQKAPHEAPQEQPKRIVTPSWIEDAVDDEAYDDSFIFKT